MFYLLSQSGIDTFNETKDSAGNIITNLCEDTDYCTDTPPYNRDEYKDFSGVDAAVNAVVRGKNITQQAEVDAMAQAIADEIAALEKQEETPVTPTEPTEPTTPGASGTIDGATEQGMNSPQTGDNNNTVMWIAVAVLAAGTMTGITFFVRKKKAE